VKRLLVTATIVAIWLMVVAVIALAAPKPHVGGY